MPIPVALELAALAHRVWCDRMAAASWRRGPYDEATLTHDALVPFEELNRHDRRHSVRLIEGSGLIEQLVDLIDYPRGPDRPFTIEEMRAGLPVAMALAPGQQPDPGVAERGVIDSWETDAEGELTCIRVRWEDGDRSEHHPVARELRRVE